MVTRSTAPGTAVLVIDAQVGVADQLGAPGAAVLARIAELVDRARLSGVPVVWTRDATVAEEGSPQWQLVDELIPEPGEPVLVREWTGCFTGTGLAELLSDLEVGQLVICGLRSEGGVLVSVAEALRSGFRVTLVTDAHASAGRGVDTGEQRTGVPGWELAALINEIVGGWHWPVGQADLLAAADVHLPDLTARDDADLLAAAEAEDRWEEDRLLEDS